MKERTIASRVIAACCAIAATFAAAACAFTTRDAVAAPTTDSASGSIAISYHHKSSDSETSDDSTNFAISDAKREIGAWDSRLHIASRGYMLGYHDLIDPSVSGFFRFLARVGDGMMNMQIVKIGFGKAV